MAILSVILITQFVFNIICMAIISDRLDKIHKDICDKIRERQ
jgi:hypothetical protein